MINYLRISVTDRCNLNCSYCRPKMRIPKVSHDAILTYEEIERFVKIAAGAGIQYVRLTGGEPLVRKDLPTLIHKVKSISGIKEVTLTTNGLALSDHLGDLVGAGLDRVNISLDTLNSERYKELTGCDRVDAIPMIWQGLMRSLESGLRPKINVVLLQGINDDEIDDFAKLTITHPLTIRFIEQMSAFTPGVKAVNITPSFTFGVKVVEECCQVVGRGPANYIRLKGGQGFVGFISSVSDCFCDTCTRLRLTSDGKLYPCIFTETHLDIRELLRSGESDATIADRLATFMSDKHRYRKDNGDMNNTKNLDMCYLGG